MELYSVKKLFGRKFFFSQLWNDSQISVSGWTWTNWVAWGTKQPFSFARFSQFYRKLVFWKISICMEYHLIMRSFSVPICTIRLKKSRILQNGIAKISSGFSIYKKLIQPSKFSQTYMLIETSNLNFLKQLTILLFYSFFSYSISIIFRSRVSPLFSKFIILFLLQPK